MPYISLQDQGFYQPAQAINNAGDSSLALYQMFRPGGLIDQQNLAYQKNKSDLGVTQHNNQATLDQDNVYPQMGMGVQAPAGYGTQPAQTSSMQTGMGLQPPTGYSPNGSSSTVSGQSSTGNTPTPGSGQFGGALTGKEAYISASAVQHHIDPKLLGAVVAEESGWGNSNAASQYNNPGGLMNPSNPKQFQSFPDIGSGIDATAANLERYSNAGLKTPGQIGQIWAPPGAANDPKGTNSGWSQDVASLMNRVNVPQVRAALPVDQPEGYASNQPAPSDQGTSPSLGLPVSAPSGYQAKVPGGQISSPSMGTGQEVQSDIPAVTKQMAQQAAPPSPAPQVQGTSSDTPSGTPQNVVSAPGASQPAPAQGSTVPPTFAQLPSEAQDHLAQMFHGNYRLAESRYNEVTGKQTNNGLFGTPQIRPGFGQTITQQGPNGATVQSQGLPAIYGAMGAGGLQMNHANQVTGQDGRPLTNQVIGMDGKVRDLPLVPPEANQAREEWNKDKVVTDTAEASLAFHNIQESLSNPNANPQEQATAIYNLQKLNNPGLGVRPQQFEQDALRGSYGQKVQSMVQQVVSGKLLTPQQSKDILTDAAGVYKNQIQTFQTHKQGRISQLQKVGLGPYANDITTTEFDGQTGSLPPQSAPTSGQAAPEGHVIYNSNGQGLIKQNGKWVPR